MPKNSSNPAQTYAKVTSIEAMLDSSKVTTLERTVETMRNKGMGAKEYEVAIKTSLKEPSPSNNVVKHQLEMHHRMKGNPTARSCAMMVEYAPVGFII